MRLVDLGTKLIQMLNGSNTLKTKPVKSGWIESISTNGLDLLVSTKSGLAYHFPGMAHHYTPMVQAESAGRYFNAYLRGSK